MDFRLNDFIDIHTHLLPGLDDGPKNVSDAIAMARCYQRVGVNTVIATPHFLPGTAWSAAKEKILESLIKFKKELIDNNVSLMVEAGMEIAFHNRLVDNLLNNKLLPLGQSEYYLIEPSFQGEQDELVACLHFLLTEGRKIILAHPERCEKFQQKSDSLIGLVEQGLLVQVNSGSLLGLFGKKSKATAKELYRRQCLHFVASDAHDSIRRHPLDLDQCANLVSCLGGDKSVFYNRKYFDKTVSENQVDTQ